VTIDGPEREVALHLLGSATRCRISALLLPTYRCKYNSTLELSSIALANPIDPSAIIMESYHLSQFPVDHSSVHLAFFKHVTNSADLRKRLVAASSMEGEEGDRERDLLDYAFVEANMVSSSVHRPDT
jgi:hypothetical protein